MALAEGITRPGYSSVSYGAATPTSESKTLKAILLISQPPLLNLIPKQSVAAQSAPAYTPS
jgi:hypothetical protein